ncbi:MAG TPA: glycine betaine ABC transporter substrate-binding protein [Steroidobacteraceae bacterium]|jgi:osmoprotectant transport system permease protein|nr:glycine betaine ABC transporter substrate-binding protein [Steroidobacteraceae bacterium]
MSKRGIGLACLALSCATALAASPPEVRIGSKNFTESVILSEMLRLDAQRHGMTLEHRRAMGGSAILWQALRQGSIDAYPEYTGTLTQELLRGLPPSASHQQLSQALLPLGLDLSESIGFEDRYALGVPEALGERLQLRSLSDLRAHPELRLALSNEFMNRADGWPGLRAAYALQPASVRGVEHSLAYRALASDAADVIDLYTTDAEIQSYHIRVLEDDRHYFPGYLAVWLYRLDSARRAPRLLRAIADLTSRISDTQMQQLNARVQVQRRDETSVASEFLSSGAASGAASAGTWQRIRTRTVEHLELVSVSLGLAMLLGLPLGVAAAKLPRLGKLVLGLAVVLQTVPSLAMLVFMIPLFGIGARPAIATLFLYSLLPIVRNTLTGLTSIPARLQESAASLGLPWQVRLLRVEAPLAARTIIAGISTAAVINVGTATLGALIGAGGYGEPILTGIRLNDLPLILEGAIPAAALALLVMAGFQLLERALTPRGLRLSFDG